MSGESLANFKTYIQKPSTKTRIELLALITTDKDIKIEDIWFGLYAEAKKSCRKEIIEALLARIMKDPTKSVIARNKNGEFTLTKLDLLQRCFKVSHNNSILQTLITCLYTSSASIAETIDLNFAYRIAKILIKQSHEINGQSYAILQRILQNMPFSKKQFQELHELAKTAKMPSIIKTLQAKLVLFSPIEKQLESIPEVDEEKEEGTAKGYIEEPTSPTTVTGLTYSP